LTVEKKLRALGLRTQKSHLWKRAVSTTTAAGGDEFDPVFQFCEGTFESRPNHLRTGPARPIVERSPREESRMMEKAHDGITEAFCWMAPLEVGNI
jgi:hypothetical protein